VNADDNIWKRLDILNSRAHTILNFIKVFDWDVFKAANDEETIERLSMDYAERQEHNISFVYAGIVFDNLKDIDENNITSVPPKVRLRLRLNSTFVHDTTWVRPKLVEKINSYILKSGIYYMPCAHLTVEGIILYLVITYTFIWS